MDMQKTLLSKANRQNYATIICGVITFLLNVLISVRDVLPTSILLPLSFIPIFCIALLLPFTYSLFFITLANIPIIFSLILNKGADDIAIYYIASTVAALFMNYFSNKQTKVTGSSLCILFWGLIIVPLYFATKNITEGNTLILIAFCSIFCCFLAETILLNQSARAFFGQSARCTNFSFVLSHAFITPLLLLGIICVQDRTIVESAIILSSIIACSYGISFSLQKLLENGSFTFTNQILGNQQSYSHSNSYFGQQELNSTTSEFPLAHLLTPSNSEPQKKRSNYGLLAVDRTETILFANKQFRDLFNLRTNTPIGQQLSDVGFDQNILEELRHLIDVTISKGPRKIEVKINQLPEKLKFIEVSSQFSSDLSNVSLGDNSSGVILKAKDISKNRTLEDHLVKTQRLNSIANVVRCISHSLNNTLAVIMGQAGCGEESKNLSEKDESFNAIIKACEEASELLRKLTGFVDDKEKAIAPVDINELLCEHKNLFKKIVGDSIDISLELPEEKLASFCDTKLIIQAITNLIINSKEAYADNKGDINIVLRKEKVDIEIADLIPGGKAGTFCCIQIKDNAVGMSPETLQHCCDALFTTKNDDTHAGLGLTMTYGIMRSLDGFLAIESHLNKGSCISLYFPLSDVAAHQLSSVDEDEQLPQKEKTNYSDQTILVVEDNDAFREVITMMLKKLGLNVHAVASSNDALNIYNPDKFSLVLSDLVMAGIDGRELLKTLREKNNKVKAIIMTAYEIPSELSLQGVNTIQKPFDMATLEKTIHSTLETME